MLGTQVLILGGGPNRIGQGIEFDYCCCHASFALRCAPAPGCATLEVRRCPLPGAARDSTV